MMENSTDPQLQRMYDQPLDFADEVQWRHYRRKAIKMALLIIALSFLPIIIDLILYMLSGVLVADGLSTTSLVNRSERIQIGLIVFWYGLFFLGLPYGLYRLIAFKKQMKILARKDLMAYNAELVTLDQLRKSNARKRLKIFAESLSGGIVKFFVGVVAVMLIVVVVGAVVAVLVL